VSTGVQIVPSCYLDLTEYLAEGENVISIEVSTTLERERAYAKNKSFMEDCRKIKCFHRLELMEKSTY
jgi:hypothetical protein